MGNVCCQEGVLDLEGEVELSHFTLLRSVGKGAFGKVRIVQHKGTKQLYALKYINKLKCIHMKTVENIISERRLLEQINHNLIVNMRYAFQDDENLFMVLDLMLGGDLRFHLDRLGSMPEEHVKFFAAEISLSLNYLHSLNIIHRDLKPDNILLNEQGHAHLTDFNIAAIVNNSRPLTSVAGSFAYIAPEILLKKGYSSSVDWWSMGVVIYELLFGKRPFRGKTNEALRHAILYDDLQFPENNQISSHAKDFIRSLLSRDITSRIGVGQQGFQRLKMHPWFHTIPWDKLETKEFMPPFTPDSKRANFDPTHELEEILLEDHPLKVKKRSHNKCSRPGASNATSFKSQVVTEPDQNPERQMMEDKFLIYDFTKPFENKRVLLDHNCQQAKKMKTAVETKQELFPNHPFEDSTIIKTISDGPQSIQISKTKDDRCYSSTTSIKGEDEYVLNSNRISSLPQPLPALLLLLRHNTNFQKLDDQQHIQLIDRVYSSFKNYNHKLIKHDYKYTQNDSTLFISGDNCRLEFPLKMNHESLLTDSNALLELKHETNARQHYSYSASVISTTSSNTLNELSRTSIMHNTTTTNINTTTATNTTTTTTNTNTTTTNTTTNNSNTTLTSCPVRISSIPRISEFDPPPLSTNLPPLPPVSSDLLPITTLA
ncbi:kinase-like domain-containing protein [Cokeromyces recurvatus]|uniref:kinase-like domain-containing protein n=1 Tax=Cokeromyces recurvatus TaxID=90255 RepID=UPI002220A7E3|nr:kinase-like domain-containing protein [Cokeromyces recurvatus]KAI7899736.1 kinase-like domain-containing protein [Cokeromyces recurvatus]